MRAYKFWETLSILAIAGCAAAQGHGHHHGHGNGSGGGQSRTFTFSASDFVTTDVSSTPQPVLNSATAISINAYLYIEGHLSANWTVSGWGAGVDTHPEFIHIYHSETISLVFSGFGNPTKLQGTSSGSQSINLSSQLKIYNEGAWSLLFDTGMVPIASLNDIFSGSGQSFAPMVTGGDMAIEFARQISITPDVGPGLYQNTGTITVLRN